MYQSERVLCVTAFTSSWSSSSWKVMLNVYLFSTVCCVTVVDEGEGRGIMRSKVICEMG